MGTAICPVCHREYEFSNAKTDRCPYSVPMEEPEPDDYDYDQSVEDDDS